MNKEAVKNEIPGSTAKPGDPANDSGVLEVALLLWDELRGLSVDRIRLAALEMQRAVDNLVSIIISGVMIAILLLSAWLGVLAAAVLVLIEVGITASSAILLAVAANLFLSLILFATIRRKRRFLKFTSTLRSLQPITPERLETEKSS
ncbi:phage holin family protein [Methylicorpusculum oleiharenae]|uniref:phage holin family protein n=1 Tax=Methylicorpusculum oleiharenae TaxID=1338687 RepID=UPI001358C6D4|nr:phage holin family protein [Methylicorpusculum oleiharenae]MCD2451629.1 phage holin family protein [Methylicorpusculum oleiharenae]